MSLIAQGITAIVGFILPKLILDHFGSEVNGLVQSIKQFLGIITFLDLGVGQVIRSSLYRPLAEKDEDALSQIMFAGRRFYKRIAYALVGYVIILTCLYPVLFVDNFDSVYTASLILVMAISSFAQYYFGIVSEQLLHADQRCYVVFSLQIVINVLNTILCVLLIQAGGSIHTVKLTTSLVYLIRPIFLYFYIQKHYKINKNIKCTGDPLQQKWNGLAQHISAVVLDGTDTIVLTLFSTLSNISIYSVYYMVISCLQQVYQAATAGLHSAAGALWATNDVDAQKRVFASSQISLHLITVFLFSCAGILIVPFIQVYTDNLTDAAYVQPLFAAILVTAYGIRCLRTPYNIWILAAGHYKQTQKCHIIAAAVNLIISVLTVSHLGLIGIALGTLAAMLYQTLWMAIYNTNHLLKWPLKSILKQFAIDIISVFVICLLCRNISLHEISYFAWFIMAIKVALVSGSVSLLMLFIFYRSIGLQLFKHFFRMK